MRVRTFIIRVQTPVISLLLSGCLSSGPEAVREPIDPPTSIIASSTTVDVNLNPDREVVTEAIVATPEAAWAALQSAYEDLKIPVGEVNHERMILGNPKFILSRNLNRNRLSTYLDCGQGPSGNYADLHRIEMQIRSSIIPVEGGVQVNTFVAAIARNMEGTSNNRIRCASKFRLEQEIAGRVRFYAEGR
jgi:hypothetical protein